MQARKESIGSWEEYTKGQRGLQARLKSGACLSHSTSLLLFHLFGSFVGRLFPPDGRGDHQKLQATSYKSASAG